jgi:redox-sensitive bicupin YhaK (pirin superfamily)
MKNRLLASVTFTTLAASIWVAAQPITPKNPDSGTMIIRRAADRGHADLDWLKSSHTFSFANYQDPHWMGFHSLSVLNDDVVAGGKGFGEHPHEDMEILTYVLSGALAHKDSIGNVKVVRAGEFQYMSAGTGVRHSEFNHSPTVPVHFLQMWIEPDRKDEKPAYAERSFKDAPMGKLNLVTSKSGRDGSIAINQDANVYLAKLNAGDSVEHQLAASRHAWVHVAEGEVSVNGEALQAGDAAGLSGKQNIKINGVKASQVLVFDLK